MFQAEALSKYKPTINSTLLVADLKKMEIMAARALEYFNSTRHIVLYYEDLVKNCTVSYYEYLSWNPEEIVTSRIIAFNDKKNNNSMT